MMLPWRMRRFMSDSASPASPARTAASASASATRSRSTLASWKPRYGRTAARMPVSAMPSTSISPSPPALISPATCLPGWMPELSRGTMATREPAAISEKISWLRSSIACQCSVAPNAVSAVVVPMSVLGKDQTEVFDEIRQADLFQFTHGFQDVGQDGAAPHERRDGGQALVAQRVDRRRVGDEQHRHGGRQLAGVGLRQRLRAVRAEAPFGDRAAAPRVVGAADEADAAGDAARPMDGRFRQEGVPAVKTALVRCVADHACAFEIRRLAGFSSLCNVYMNKGGDASKCIKNDKDASYCNCVPAGTELC